MREILAYFLSSLCLSHDEFIGEIHFTVGGKYESCTLGGESTFVLGIGELYYRTEPS